MLLPPSIHASGPQYRWLDTKADELAPVPDTLFDLHPSRTQQSKQSQPLVKTGARNDTVFRTACLLRQRVKDDQLVFEMMKVFNKKALAEPLSEQELRTAVNSSGNYAESVEELFGPPATTTPLEMKFVWYPYIPRYGLTIIAGDPGRGKSLLIALLIAIVTANMRWPLSTDPPEGGKVLLLSAEDNFERVTLHRLIKAGADVTKLRQMLRFRALTDERLDMLEDYMLSERPELVVIDTLSAYMGGGRDMHRQNEVGEFLARLTEIADKTGSAIIGLAHLNKQSNEVPLYRIVGSIGFAASIRSALFLGKDPDDPTRLALAHGKSNAAEIGKTIIFEKIGGGRDDVPVLRPVGFSDATDRDVCRVEANPIGRPTNEREAAINFVLSMLSDEPIPWTTIQRAAEARSIASEGTLNIIRADLAKDGRIVMVGHAKKSKWILGTSFDNADQN